MRKALNRVSYECEVRLNIDLKKALGLTGCPVIQCAGDIASAFKGLIHLEREVVVSGALDCRCRLLQWSLLAVGSSHLVSIRVGDAFQEAIRTGAMGIVLVHNHPSGSLEPSREDRDLTNLVKDAGWLLGYPLLDHVIVAKTGHRSLMHKRIEKLSKCLAHAPMIDAAENRRHRVTS